jgi:hypothetical protein
MAIMAAKAIEADRDEVMRAFPFVVFEPSGPVWP